MDNLEPPQVELASEEKNRRLFNKVLLGFFVMSIPIATFFIGIERGRYLQREARKSFPIDQTIVLNKDLGKPESLDFSLYWRVWDLLKDKYVDSKKLDATKLFYGSIKGMLAATGDPYTAFFDPEETKSFKEEIEGSFEGIGAEVGMRNGILTIIAPLEDSPAARAGIRAGDKVIKIDDQSTLDLGIDQSVSLMRGPKDTSVKLTILREGIQETQDIVVWRAIVQIKSVTAEIKNDNIAYIKVSRFGDDTEQAFAVAVRKTINAETKGIIVDVRNDPGGYLDAAVGLGSKMLPMGSTIVIEEREDGTQHKLFAAGGDTLSHIPTVVLINNGSASASEILAGALRDNRQNVTIMGEKSFGKGSVQEFLDLPDNTAVKITIEKWLTPNGEQINEKGITPGVEVKLSDDDFEQGRDPQLDAALKALSE
ncbi:S41 family peptidase [Patescibacteria group bacterium]|nr:MAG: S41 family peptidase [Patescibacteria group bacterium]